MHWPWSPLPFSLILREAWLSLRHATIPDIFDVAAVTLLIYLILIWVRRGRAVRVIQGMVIFGIIYLVSTQIGLTLTSSVFRGFLTIVMVSMVSFFQEDLRRFFERLSFSSMKSSTLKGKSFDAILRSVRHFSKEHIGALIVLRGNDLLDRHLESGHVLGGRVSSALLESLFDPHSDGHDGAVVVEGDRVTRFGVHLPLSKNIDASTGMGTRHAAALGISELTDALCVVVSEKKGTVSLAYEGKWVSIHQRKSLEAHLHDFARLHRRAAQSPWTHWMASHSREKVLALMLGTLAWLVLVKGIKPIERTIEIPIVAQNLPDGLHVKQLSPQRASLTIMGLQKNFTEPMMSQIALSLPLEHPKAGMNHLQLGAEAVTLPENFHLVSITPGSVNLQLTSRSKGSSKERSSVVSGVPRRSAWFSFR